MNRKRLFVPCDSVALALGAESVVEAISEESDRRGFDVTIVRNGSRGMFWLEPFIEVETESGRKGFGPVSRGDVPSLFDAGFLSGGEHPLSAGLTEEIDFLKNQERVTFRRVGITDPLSIDAYRTYGGFRGLENALRLSAFEIVRQVTDSGLRGRGGAAFPAGVKWQTALNCREQEKFIVCNGDEGDSGAFADRMLMEGDPFLLIEGMAIAALAVGATTGYIYVRSEYPAAVAVLNRAISIAAREGYLGSRILGSERNFTLEVRKGAGSYICGEETALLESLEGRKGIVRAKPPLPAISGLFGKPTVVNNVITLASVPVILEKGPEAYRAFGTGRSRGTMPFQLSGNIRRGGLIEKGFGVTLRELLFIFGQGSASGLPIKAVQVGGPLGTYLPESQWDTPMDYEAYTAMKAVLGHGGIVVHDQRADMARLARFAMKFCAIESCGKCTPCRIGATRGVEVMDRILSEPENGDSIGLLRDLCDTMMNASMCAMGGMTPFPVLSALNHFPEDFMNRPGRPAGIGRMSP